MADPDLKIVRNEPKTEGAGDGTGGSGIEQRLRAVEQGLTRIETKLDAELRHLATKTWVLGGVVAGMVIAATLAVSLTFIIIKLSSPL